MRGVVGISAAEGIKELYKEKNLVYYTKGEEVANTATHFLGAVFGICTFSLLAYAKTPLSILATVVTALAMTIPYIFSTLYHGTKNLDIKAIFRRVDHAAVSFIILGCGAPLCLLMTRRAVDYIAFSLCILIIAVNIALCAHDFKRFSKTALVLDYICAALLIMIYVVNRTTVPQIAKLFYLLGSVFCAVGAVMYLIRKRYTHTIFHIFMLMATTMYYTAGLFLILQENGINLYPDFIL